MSSNKNCGNRLKKEFFINSVKSKFGGNEYVNPLELGKYLYSNKEVLTIKEVQIFNRLLFKDNIQGALLLIMQLLNDYENDFDDSEIQIHLIDLRDKLREVRTKNDIRTRQRKIPIIARVVAIWYKVNHGTSLPELKNPPNKNEELKIYAQKHNDQFPSQSSFRTTYLNLSPKTIKPDHLKMAFENGLFDNDDLAKEKVIADLKKFFPHELF